MLITHALQTVKTQKGQTPKRKINRIATTKNPLLQPTFKNLPKSPIENKQNQNPNIRKSPSPTHDYKPTQQSYTPFNNQQRQVRIKSQCYPTGVPPTKQSPIKKILFVKNLSYKSTKTSKNSSLDNKKQDSQHQNKYVSLGGLHRDESGRLRDQRKSYSQYNNTKSFAENESEIFVEHKPNERIIQQFRPKQMIIQNNQSQASYRMSPNELHTKMAKFKQTYISEPQSQQLTRTNGQKLPNFEYPSSFNSQSFHSKSIKMCPNIESADLSELESFKNNKYLNYGKKEVSACSNVLALIVDKEKKESLSSKKRTSRIKLNTKNSQKHRQSFNDENFTEESDCIVSIPSQPIFDEQCKDATMGIFQTTKQSQNGTKSTNSKQQQQESTLVETKKFEDTFDNLNSELSKASQSDSIHCQIRHIRLQNPIEKHSAKHYCLNHPQKQAKFKVDKQGERPYYCSKCTVLLVTHGYKVVQNLDQKNQRLQKLKSFIFQLQILQPKLHSSHLNITHLQSQLTSLQSQAHTSIQTYYTTLITSLQSHKQTLIKSLNYHASKVMSQLSLLKTKIQQNTDEIGFLKNDILPNVDLIVDEVKIPAHSWNKIICEHQVKMEEIQRIVDMMGKVLNGHGDNKITIKTVQIPTNQTKSALNLLQQTQIVFKQKILKLQLIPLQQTSPSHMNETKRSFSFDDENIDTSFYVPSSKKKGNSQLLSPEGVENIYELTDSIRLSFGNRLEHNGREGVQSPTFKAI